MATGTCVVSIQPTPKISELANKATVRRLTMSYPRLISWLTLSDYDEARNQATKRIVARYSRGNVTAQAGNLIEEADLRCMSERADASMVRLNKLVKS